MPKIEVEAGHFCLLARLQGVEDLESLVLIIKYLFNLQTKRKKEKWLMIWELEYYFPARMEAKWNLVHTSL